MRVDLRQLRYFVAVAEELSFQRAAQRVFITQPALSQQIARLEDELGVQLLVRTTRSVELTPGGRHLLEGANGLLQQASRLFEDVRVAAQAFERRLTIAYPEYLNPPFIPAALREFSLQHPDVRVERINATSTEAVPLLRTGKLDLHFGITPPAPDFAQTDLLHGRMTLVLHRQHPLATRRTLDVADLGGHPLIFFARAQFPPLHDEITGLIRGAGVEPHYAYEVLTASVGADMAAQGLGAFLVMSYIPLGLGAAQRRQVKIVPVQGLPGRVLRATAMQANRSPYLQDFVQIIRAGLRPAAR
jgi:DNA-binding transcriptional LysR family regulator